MKQELLNILKNPNDKLIAIDMDGTICTGKFWETEECKPIQKMIDKVCSLYKNGAHIIIYTARDPKYYEVTNAWLMKYGVPFHGISMQKKIGADLYIDDKSLNVEDVP